MLDLKYIRENPELVKQGIINKNEKSRIDEILELDRQRREMILATDELKTRRNQASQQVAQLKKSGGDASAIITEMKTVSDSIAENDGKLNEIEKQLQEMLMYIPNLPHSSVPVGKTAEENVEVRQWLPEGFSFKQEEKAIDHIELGKKLKILDFERGAKISGSGFPLYTGKGATLERALINFMLDYHLQHHGYKETGEIFLYNHDAVDESPA